MHKAGSIPAGIAVVALLALVPAAAIGANANLGIDKTDSADPATVGTEFQYTLTVSNAGPENATGVTVTDDLPNDVDLVAATPSQGACDVKGKKVTCDLGTLANGANATVTLRVVPKRAGQIVNTATVSSADTDAYAQNNSDSETTTVVEGSEPTCGGQTATKVGTTGNDEIAGTDKRDVIVAMSGDDRIFALGGRDLVCGNGGADLIKGRGDDDVLRGGGGNDSLGGGPGDDLLRGGTGTDRCKGGPGHDVKRSCP